MNRVSAENIGNARDLTLLGGRLQLENGRLSLGEKDLLRNETSYFYFTSISSRDEFINTFRQHYITNGELHVFDGASINYKLKYIPALKCGVKILTLNSEDDYFVTDHFFDRPHSWFQKWNNIMAPVIEGCLQGADVTILPIKLSEKEINYLVPRLGLPLSEQFQVVLMPFHVACITGKEHEYHVAQIAIEGEPMIWDFPEFEDSTFSSMSQVLIISVLYAASAAVVLDNIDQIIPFAKSYGNLGLDIIKSIDDSLYIVIPNYIPILGKLVAGICVLLIAIIIFILMAGIAPAIMLSLPAIVATILAFCVIWSRRIYLRIKKKKLFDKMYQ